MIIRYPTGLYDRQLPKNNDAGSVVWTISTQAPTRPDIRVVRLPIAQERRPLPPGLYNAEERRAAEGSLLFTLLRADKSAAASGTRQYGAGEYIEFEAETVEALPTETTPAVVEIMHNTNVLDLAGVGLTEDEIATLTNQSVARKKELEIQLVSIKTEIEDLKVQIGDNQKKLNETNKVLAATRQIFGIQDGDVVFDNAVYQKLLTIRNELETTRSQLAIAYQNKLIESTTTYNSLLQVSELVH